MVKNYFVSSNYYCYVLNKICYYVNKLRRMGPSCFKRAIFLEYLISAYQLRNYYNIETLFESGAELHFPQMIFIDS